MGGTHVFFLLTRKQQNTDPYSRSGIYKLSCPDCGKAYVGQTGRSFTTRFREHKEAFKTATRPSNFAKHLAEHAHSFGPIQNIMKVVQIHKKGLHLNTLERFHIYTEHKNDNHLNDDTTVFPNKIFDTLMRPHRP